METHFQTTETTLGELIVSLYAEYLAIYRDPDIAAVAAAATLNEVLAGSSEVPADRDRARAA